MAPSMCVAVSQSTRLCSMSTVSHANPARAMNRAAVMLPSDSHVPTEGWPALRAFLTGFARILETPWNGKSPRAAARGLVGLLGLLQMDLGGVQPQQAAAVDERPADRRDHLRALG